MTACVFHHYRVGYNSLLDVMLVLNSAPSGFFPGYSGDLLLTENPQFCLIQSDLWSSQIVLRAQVLSQITLRLEQSDCQAPYSKITAILKLFCFIKISPRYGV